MAFDKGGVTASIVSKWDDRGAKAAQRDFAKLGQQSQKSSKAVDGMSTSFKRLGVTLLATFSAAAIARGLKSTIDAASSLEEAQSKVNVVFGDGAVQVEQWADTANTALVMSKSAALEAAGTFGNLFQAFGLGQGEAQRMSQTLVQVAADLASFNNTTTDEALTAIRSGLSGEQEALKRFGIAATDARLKQEALNLGIYDGTGILNANQKAQAAYQIIMKDSALAQGDVARTADNYANQMRALQGAVEDASAAIGKELLNSISNVSEALGGTDGMSDVIGETGDNLAGLIRSINIAAQEIADAGVVTDNTGNSFGDWLALSYKLVPGIGGVVTQVGNLVDIGSKEIRVEEALNDEIARSIQMRHIYASAMDRTTSAIRDDLKYANLATDALKKLNDVMGKAGSLNQSVLEGRMDQRNARREGVTPSGGEKGKVVTKDDARSFAFDYASTTRGLAADLVEQGKLKAARRTLREGQAVITDTVGQYLPNAQGLAGKLLPIDPEIGRGIAAKARARSEAGANQWRDSARQAGTVIRIDKVEVSGATPAEQVRQLREWVRMKALQMDRTSPGFDRDLVTGSWGNLDGPR